MKNLAVVILNWNGIKLLKQFLPTASKYTISDSVDLFVADNGSTDDSVEWIERNHPEVKIIKLDKNYGFAEGYNRAINAIDYPFVTLLNSDVEVTPNWWKPILDFMIHHPEAGAVQPKIRSFADKSKFEYAGAAGGYLDALGYPFCRGRLFEAVETDNGQYDGDPVEITWASGACITVKTDLYKNVGGLDPKFFAHMEEIDLCCRLINNGFKIFAISDSAVFHVGGASLNQGNPQKTYLNFRNNLLLLHKNLPAIIGKEKLFIRRLTDTLAFGMFLLKGDFQNAKAILRAHGDFRKMKKEYTSFPDSDNLSSRTGGNMYAVWEHYILRKNSLF